MYCIRTCVVMVCDQCLAVSGLSDGTGSSGNTYKHGVLKAMERTNPAIFIFENVATVIEHPTDKKGRRMEAPIEACGSSNTAKVNYSTVLYSTLMFFVLHSSQRPYRSHSSTVQYCTYNTVCSCSCSTNMLQYSTRKHVFLTALSIR